jgi:hypothetical protein
VVDGVFIHTTHLHAVGNGGLLQQALTGRRRRSQQQHSGGDGLAMRMAAATCVV